MVPDDQDIFFHPGQEILNTGYMLKQQSSNNLNASRGAIRLSTPGLTLDAESNLMSSYASPGLLDAALPGRPLFLADCNLLFLVESDAMATSGGYSGPAGA